MKNIVYVVANVATETIILVTPDRDTAYRTAMLEQKVYDARKKDVSITPMRIDTQMGRGTSMCYDDADLSEALSEIKEWDEDEDEDEDDWDEDEDEDEDDWDEDEDEDDWEEDEDEDEDEYEDEDEDEYDDCVFRHGSHYWPN